jgi:hypothetical protein
MRSGAVARVGPPAVPGRFALVQSAVACAVPVHVFSSDVAAASPKKHRITKRLHERGNPSRTVGYLVDGSQGPVQMSVDEVLKDLVKGKSKYEVGPDSTPALVEYYATTDPNGTGDSLSGLPDASCDRETFKIPPFDTTAGRVTYEVIQQLRNNNLVKGYRVQLDGDLRALNDFVDISLQKMCQVILDRWYIKHRFKVGTKWVRVNMRTKSDPTPSNNLENLYSEPWRGTLPRCHHEDD